MTKSIRFYETTTGHIAEINRVITYFIRKEEHQASLEWFVYRSEDGGKGFRRIPICADDIDTRGHKTLNAAKRVIIERESYPSNKGNGRGF